MSRRHSLFGPLAMGILALTAGLAACGGKPPAPKIAVAPTRLDFEMVPVGASATLPLQISNAGKKPLTISAVTVADQDDVSVSASDELTTDCSGNPRMVADPKTLAPGACAAVNIKFTPKTAEMLSTRIIVVSNDPSQAAFQAPVTASSTGQAQKGPQIQVCVLQPDGTQDPAQCSGLSDMTFSVPSLDFGTIGSQQMQTRTVRLLNTGDTGLAVSAVTLQSSSPDFAIQGTPKFPAMIAPAGKLDVSVGLTAREPGSVAGKLAILSTDPSEMEVDVPLSGKVGQDCLQVTPMTSLDFGSVAIGTTSQKQLSIQNCGTSSLQIVGLTFTPDAPGSSVFSFSNDIAGQTPLMVPVSVTPAAPDVVYVSYTPTMATPANSAGDTGTLVVRTSDGVQTSIAIKGQGNANACTPPDAPTASITASTANGMPITGAVPVGTTITLDGSASTAPGSSIESYQWVVLSAPIGSKTSEGTGPQYSLALSLPGTYEVGLTVTAADHCVSAQTTFTVQTSAAACTQSPKAQIALSNGMAPLAGGVAPDTTVTLSGTGSMAGDVPIQAYQWTILSAPAGSTAAITGSGSTASLQVVLTGTYEIGLTVTDTNGCSSTQATATIEVVQSPGIRVELTWPEDYGDLDLHFVGPGGTIFSMTGGDLNYAYSLVTVDGYTGTVTQNTFPMTIDWGRMVNGMSTDQPDGTHTDDPIFDDDQTWGKGPEDVSYPHPFDGDFEVMVHYYCSSLYDEATAPSGMNATSFGPATANVTIYFNGTAQFTSQQKLTAKQVWDVATIHVSNSGNSILITTENNSVTQSTDGCPDSN